MSHCFNPSKKFKRHLCNVHRWQESLPDAVSDETYSPPLSIDVELEEFLIIRDLDTSKDLYLAMVCEIHELFFTVECWGCTHKHNRQKGIFKITHVLEDGSPTTMIPHKDVTSNPWMWQIDFDTLLDCVLVRNVEVLPTGKLDATTQAELLKLPSNLTQRRFIS
jgi:hypothetical protein